jgi:hypothetical protein
MPGTLSHSRKTTSCQRENPAKDAKGKKQSKGRKRLADPNEKPLLNQARLRAGQGRLAPLSAA